MNLGYLTVKIKGPWENKSREYGIHVEESATSNIHKVGWFDHINHVET
jgi:hypothetical protein